MDFETAMDSEVSLDEALNELAQHGITADFEGDELFDCQNGETIAWRQADGMYKGGDVLAYLGY